VRTKTCPLFFPESWEHPLARSFGYDFAFHEVARTAAEGRQRLDVLGYVKHEPARMKAPF